jgi:hypothetical protein
MNRLNRVMNLLQRFLRMLMEFKTKNGHCDVPEAGGGPNKLLHSWMLRQRQKRKIGTVGALYSTQHALQFTELASQIKRRKNHALPPDH